jgi:transcriptional regulator with XRE-family HTH domain
MENLKRLLKVRNMTYKQLGENIGLSEAGVKRMFAERTCTIERLEQILAVFQLTFTDLLQMLRDGMYESSTLLYEQEVALANDQRLFALFHLLLFGHSVAWIKKNCKFQQGELEKMLRILDRLRLIELGPNDKVRTLTRRNIDWLPDGPLRKTVGPRILKEFLEGPFEGDDQMRHFATRHLSFKARTLIQDRLSRLFADLDDLAETSDLDDQEDISPTSLFVAFRGWTFSWIGDLKK